MDGGKAKEFEQELIRLLEKHQIDRETGDSPQVLAQYVISVLGAYRTAKQSRQFTPLRKGMQRAGTLPWWMKP